jgi:surface antigen
MSGMKFVAVAFTGLTLAACANDPSAPSQGISATFGALTGAFASTPTVPNTDSRIAGAAGASLDEPDRQRAYAAQMQAIQHGEPGAPVSWRSAESGRYGTVVPGPAYQSNGTTCREYSHTIYIDRKPQSARGTACRNPDGTWAPVS